MTYYSKRSIPLILTYGSGQPLEGASYAIGVITAELYVKWYELYIVSDGCAHVLDFHDLEPYTPAGESTYVDHVPNPKAIQAFAEATGRPVDPTFLEVAYGRWFLEVTTRDSH